METLEFRIFCDTTKKRRSTIFFAYQKHSSRIEIPTRDEQLGDSPSRVTATRKISRT